jgi:uncharacterized repeat protein (TIGR01451 family)
MRISPLILFATLATFFSGMSLAAYAAEGAIKITSTAEVEREVVVNGKKEMKRMPVTKAVPGTEIIFTNQFENVTAKAASDVVINNPIPESTEYKAGSAFGADCDIQFSVDSGKKFGHAEELKIKDADGTEHTALAKDYTNIRWVNKSQLPAGKAGEVGFRVIIK